MAPLSYYWIISFMYVIVPDTGTVFFKKGFFQMNDSEIAAFELFDP